MNKSEQEWHDSLLDGAADNGGDEADEPETLSGEEETMMRSIPSHLGGATMRKALRIIARLEAECAKRAKNH